MRSYRGEYLALAFILAVSVAGLNVAFAADYYVDGDNGTDDDGHGSGPGPGAWKTITYALNWIQNNDPGSATNAHTIHIAAYTYAPSTNGETYPLNMQDWVSISGADRETTILDAQKQSGIYHVICCAESDNLSIQNLTVTGGNANGSGEYDPWGGGILCRYSSPTLTNCLISGNSADVGGGMFCRDSSPMIANCDISGNYAVWAGGGVCFYMESHGGLMDCTVSGNSVGKYDGGGLYLVSASPSLTRCTVSNNTTPLWGGGLCSESSHSELTDCVILGNSVMPRNRCYGGGIACDYSALVLKNCTISGNSGGEYGGGFYCTNYQDENFPTLTDCVISDNYAWHDGAGLALVYSSSTLTNCTISGNSAAADGGGIYCSSWGSTPTLLIACALLNNSAHRGGGIYCSYGPLFLTGCTVSNNHVSHNGGGVWCNPRTTPEFTSCLVTGNTAAHYGGGIFCYYNTDAELTNCLVVHNSSNYGGGLCCSSYPNYSSSFALWSCTVADNSASQDRGGGGLYCPAGCSANIKNSILWGDTANGNASEIGGDGAVTVAYSDVERGWDGEGNIDSDPLFVPVYDAPYYLAHAGAQAADSPCLDAAYGSVGDYGLGGTTTCTDAREDADPIDMGYHYSGGYEGDGDTSVKLTSFEARSSGSGVLLIWQTATEIDNAGFVIFRTILGAHDYELISHLIPARGALASGASYRFTDGNIKPGITYDYWLIDVDTRGGWTAHGPASARAEPGLRLSELPRGDRQLEVGPPSRRH